MELPEYQVVNVTDQLVGGKFGEILIPSLKVDMDVDSLSQIAFAILEREGLDEGSFYVTESARKADFSASYSEQHPNAAKEGYLGAIRKGQFEPSPYVHDERFR